MTVLSVFLGFATMIIPYTITFYTSTALLALFGVKMLYEGYKMDPNEGQEELEEVSEELRKRDESVSLGEGEGVVNFRGTPQFFFCTVDANGPRAGGSGQSPPEEKVEILWALRVPHLSAGIHPHLPGRVGGPVSAHHHHSRGKRGVCVCSLSNI